MPREGGDMAGALNVRHGSKMRLAFDAPLGQEDILHMAESVYLVETTK